MKRAIRWRPALLGLGVALLASMLVAEAADAASIRLYRDRNFQGPSKVYNYADNNLAGSGQNNRVTSARIISGNWELCSGRNFSGHCEIVSSDVRNLSSIGLNNNVSSIRPVSGGGWSSGGGWGNRGITLFENRNYTGKRRNFTSADNNLRRSGLNNRVTSARIISGVWELCSGRNFTGRCEIVSNNVGNLGSIGLNNNVSSIRPVSGGGWGSGGGIGNRGVTLFIDRNYQGLRRNFTGAENNLRRTGLNNKVSSIRVLSGRWLLCTGANYTGDCLTFSRNVPNLGQYGINNNVSSLRPVTGNPWGGNWWSNNPWRGTWFGFAFSNRRPGRGDLVIFEDAGYRGRSAVVDRNMPNLRRTGLNDNISSLSVRDGVWKLCAQANYRGRCITVSDDVYNLRGVFNDRISSIQRIR